VGVVAQEAIAAALAEVSKGLSSEIVGALTAACEEDGFKGKAGQMVVMPSYGMANFKRICFIGLGADKDMSLSVYRKLAVQAARRFNALSGRGKTKAKSAALLIRAKSKSKTRHLDGSLVVEAIVESWILASYSFLKYKSGQEQDKENEKKSGTSVLSIVGSGLDKAAFEQAAIKGRTIAEATNFARELIAEPPAVMTPTKLAAEARRVAREGELSIKVLDQAQVEKLGMGSFLGVALGAAEPLKFIVIKYDAPRSKKTIALVGKGITFDSGGLSLKTAVGMEHMKYDMSGAAAVLGTMQVVGRLKPRVSVLAVMAATENMPGPAALHPGDVLKSMNGKTIEVNNTDAEGRLILADAITYAVKEGVDEIIDIATLTGAVVTALGRVAAGIMGSNQTLIDRLIACGADGGEKFWQLPLYEEYKEGLKSDIADLKNAGSRGEAGTCSAAMFLQEFTAAKPWAHMDIAGPAWQERERDDLNKGGTAFGVRTLSRYVLSN
jgi:leucyl aminopeptidase